MSAWGLPLARFVGDMAEQLEANDHKDGWEQRSPLYLLRRLREETDELEDRIRSKTVLGKSVRQEAADVANFCMMIADLARAEELEVPDGR